MDLTKIKEFISIREDLLNQGVIGINMWENNLHISLSKMVKLPSLQVKVIEGSEYPIKIYTEVDGIKLSALAKESEAEKYPIIQKLIAEHELELLTPSSEVLDGMTEDVDLSGDDYARASSY